MRPRKTTGKLHLKKAQKTMTAQNGLKICCDRILPDDAHPRHVVQRQARIAAALQGTSRKTARELFHDLDPRQILPPERMAIINAKVWPRGSTLKCRFLGGSKAQQDKAVAMAAEWMQYANISI